MSSGSSNATWPDRLSRQRASITARWADSTASDGTDPWAWSLASHWVAEAGASLASNWSRRLGATPISASRTWASATWSKTARRSALSRSPSSSILTSSDKDRLLPVGVGKSETAVVVEATEPLGQVGLGGLGIVESERSEMGQAAPEDLGRAGRQGPEYLGPHGSGRAGEGQSPGGGVLDVIGLLDVAIIHPNQVLEHEPEPAQAEAIEFLEDCLLLDRRDPLKSGDLEGHGLDGRPVELRQELRSLGLLQADQEDGRLAQRGRVGGEFGIGVGRDGRPAARPRGQGRSPTRGLRVCHADSPPWPIQRWRTLAADSGLSRISSRTRSDGPGPGSEGASTVYRPRCAAEAGRASGRRDASTREVTNRSVAIPAPADAEGTHQGIDLRASVAGGLIRRGRAGSSSGIVSIITSWSSPGGTTKLTAVRILVSVDDRASWRSSCDGSRFGSAYKWKLRGIYNRTRAGLCSAASFAGGRDAATAGIG